MTTDVKGQELKVGDVVLVPCRVRWVFEDEGNVNVETIEPDTTTFTTHFSVNSKQLVQVSPADPIISALPNLPSPLKVVKPVVP